MPTVEVKDTPHESQYGYEYRNQYTRGWVGAKFDPADMPTDWESALPAALRYKSRWGSGTEVRAVEIDTQKFSEPL